MCQLFIFLVNSPAVNLNQNLVQQSQVVKMTRVAGHPSHLLTSPWTKDFPINHIAWCSSNPVLNDESNGLSLWNISCSLLQILNVYGESPERHDRFYNLRPKWIGNSGLGYLTIKEGACQTLLWNQIHNQDNPDPRGCQANHLTFL